MFLVQWKDIEWHEVSILRERVVVGFPGLSGVTKRLVKVKYADQNEIE